MKNDPRKLKIEEWNELIVFNKISGRAWYNEISEKWFKNGKHSAKRRMNAWNSQFAGKEITYKNSGGYVQFRILGFKDIKLHRLVWFINTGKQPELEIDHINGDPSDNRFENLREVPHCENLRNKRLPSNNRSGVIGVGFHKQSSKWRARINDSTGKQIYLGLFENFEDAVAARKAAEIEYGYHKNHGRN